MRFPRRTVGAAAVVLTVLASGHAVAGVRPTPSRLGSVAVDRLHAVADAAIAKRLALLSLLTEDVRAASHLTAADRSSLLAELSADTKGLTALQVQIDADDNLSSLLAEVRSIVTEYWVFAEVAPKVHLVRAADFALDVIAKVQGIEPTLKALIDRAKTAGKDVSTAQQAYHDLVAQLSAAKKLVAPIPDRMVALMAADYPTPAQSTMQDARQELLAASADLTKARADAHAIVDSLLSP